MKACPAFHLGVPAPAGTRDTCPGPRSGIDSQLVTPGRKHALDPDTGPESRGWEPRSAGASSQPRIPDTPPFFILSRGPRKDLGDSRHPLRHIRHPTSSFRRRPESRRGGDGQARHTISKTRRPAIFHPLTRPSQGHGDSRHPLRHSREGGNPGEVYGFANDPQTTPTISTLIFMPWCAGDNRHGRLLRKLVPDQDPG